jgi:hypothetical protein
MRTVYTRNILLDSESGNVRGDKLATKINFPSSSFAVRQGQLMRLTLSQFQMPRRFYNINQNNNAFFIYNPVGPVYTPVVIPPGNYATGTALASAIQTVLASAIVGSTCTFALATRKFTITLGGTAPAAGYLVCFQLKDEQPPATVDPVYSFVDTHEILGCIPTRDGFGAQPVNAFGSSVAAGPHISPYVGSLSSIECVYVRISLPTNNYQSVNFERDTPLSSQEVIPSSIFARIPLVHPVYQEALEGAFIEFTDPNGIFAIMLDQQQLNTVEFQVTDDRGRPLPSVAPGQSAAGLLNYKMTVKFDIVEHESPPASHRVELPEGSGQRVSSQFR